MLKLKKLCWTSDQWGGSVALNLAYDHLPHWWFGFLKWKNVGLSLCAWFWPLFLTLTQYLPHFSSWNCFNLTLRELKGKVRFKNCQSQSNIKGHFGFYSSSISPQQVSNFDFSISYSRASAQKSDFCLHFYMLLGLTTNVLQHCTQSEIVYFFYSPAKGKQTNKQNSPEAHLYVFLSKFGEV